MSFPPHPIPEGMLRHSFVSPSRKEGPPSIWDTHCILETSFANPDASLSKPYPQELNQWSSSIALHLSTVETSEKPEGNQDLRYQFGPSAKDSVIFSGRDSSKIYGTDKQRLKILDLHFDKFPTPDNVCLLEDKVQDRGMYLFAISYGSDAMDQRNGDG